jgi:hypothetical protein
VTHLTCPNCRNRISVKVIPVGVDRPVVENINYSVTGLATGLAVWLFSWVSGISGGEIFAIVVALGSTVGLQALKLWLYRPRAHGQKQDKQTIQIEHVEDGKHWIINELKCDIELKQLQRVSREVIGQEWRWSRSIATSSGLSQTKANQLKDELLRLEYLQPLPNNANGYKVTGRGRRTFYHLAMLGVVGMT